MNGYRNGEIFDRGLVIANSERGSSGNCWPNGWGSPPSPCSVYQNSPGGVDTDFYINPSGCSAIPVYAKSNSFQPGSWNRCANLGYNPLRLSNTFYIYPSPTCSNTSLTFSGAIDAAATNVYVYQIIQSGADQKIAQLPSNNVVLADGAQYYLGTNHDGESSGVTSNFFVFFTYMGPDYCCNSDCVNCYFNNNTGFTALNPFASTQTIGSNGAASSAAVPCYPDTGQFVYSANTVCSPYFGLVQNCAQQQLSPAFQVATTGNYLFTVPQGVTVSLYTQPPNESIQCNPVSSLSNGVIVYLFSNTLYYIAPSSGTDAGIANPFTIGIYLSSE